MREKRFGKIISRVRRREQEKFERQFQQIREAFFILRRMETLILMSKAAGCAPNWGGSR